MAFGDRMAMGEGLAANLSCGHPHVDQFVNASDDIPHVVICPLCGQYVKGSLRELPKEEKTE